MNIILEAKQAEISTEIIRNHLPTIMEESEIAGLSDDLTFENFPQLMMDPEIQLEIVEAMTNAQESAEEENLFSFTQENVVNAMKMTFEEEIFTTINPII